MKKLAFLFTLMVGLGLVLSACGAPAPAPTEVVAPTAVPATAVPPTAVPAKPFRVAVVMPSAKNDLAFSQSMYDALLRVQTDMGGPAKMEIAFSENMFVVDDAAAAIRDYATKGYDLVIAHGSQYGSSLQEIAPDFPKTSFAWGTTADTFGQPNIFAYQAAADQGGYVNGAVAASLSKSKAIGVIGPIETGDAKLYVDGFKAGVAATDRTIKVSVTYTGSFSDTALASAAATTQIAAGADVLTGSAQMVVGAIGKAQESNVLWFGTQSNQTSLAPTVVVASQVYHWEVVLKQMLDLIKAGTLGGKTFSIDLANGGEVVEFNAAYALPADAKALADKTVQGITDGSIKVTLP
jgi:basic membrane lipoprotein Med (substrate-binding protein (PBP1-ABC) superfamily)